MTETYQQQWAQIELYLQQKILRLEEDKASLAAVNEALRYELQELEALADEYEAEAQRGHPLAMLLMQTAHRIRAITKPQ